MRQTWIYPNDVAAPYDPTYVNEFMTPLPKGMSGIFVISENQGRLHRADHAVRGAVQEKATRTVDATLWYLCGTSDPDPTSPNYQKTMDATWANPAITGVFIRLKWSDLQTGPTTYSDTACSACSAKSTRPSPMARSTASRSSLALKTTQRPHGSLTPRRRAPA